MNKVFQYFIAAVILLSSHLSVNAQEQLGLREKANNFYFAYQYVKAGSVYLKLVDVKNPRLSDLERLAECYVKISDYQSAENWYARVVADPKSELQNLVKYAMVLKFNARYAEAKKVLQQYVAQSGDTKVVLNEIAGCDSALIWMAKPSNHKLKNESQVNTAFSEFGVFPIGNKVYYVGEPDHDVFTEHDGRTGNPFLRIYTADRNSDHSLSAKLIDKSTYNNEPYHVGPIISNKAGNMLLITRTYTGKSGEISKESKLNFRTSNLELYTYKANNGQYQESAFPYNDVKKYSTGHAALSNDEQTLYFVSDRPGGLGGTDIWFCELQSDKKWGPPQNAGSEINSVGNEMFPVIQQDGALYYSSNGFPGMGGLDIFMTKGAKNNWSKPENLKYPINSSADDFSFVIMSSSDGDVSGYLSSSRKGGIGGDDIYSFSNIKPKLILALKGISVNKKTFKPLADAPITLYSADRRMVAKQSSEGNGTFFFELERETNYTVLGQKTQFYSDSVTLSTKGLMTSDTLNITLRLDPLFETGKTIALENIYYDFDKDNIRQDAAKKLDELVGIMRDNPTLQIELGSHTDSRGRDSYNLDLSQRRAGSVVDYLVNRGISRNRLTAKGYGETQPLNHCVNGIKCLPADHQANRRTEFKVLSF